MIFCKYLLLAILLTMSSVPTVCLGSFGSFDEAYAEGKSKFEMQDYTAAQDAFTASLDLARDAAQRAQARLGLGNCLLEFQDYDGCRALAEQTLEEDARQPGWPQVKALGQIAESYRREKKFEEITATIDRAGGWNAGLVNWLNLEVAQMLYVEQQLEQSEQFYRNAAAVEDKGTRGWAFYWLARIAQESGRKDQALEYLEQFQQLGLDDDDIINSHISSLRERL